MFDSVSFFSFFSLCVLQVIFSLFAVVFVWMISQVSQHMLWWYHSLGSQTAQPKDTFSSNAVAGRFHVLGQTQSLLETTQPVPSNGICIKRQNITSLTRHVLNDTTGFEPQELCWATQSVWDAICVLEQQDICWTRKLYRTTQSVLKRNPSWTTHHKISVARNK